jgi:hypothetical protein
MKKHYLIGAALALSIGAAFAQTIPLPYVTSVQPTDAFQDIVGGVPSAQNKYVSGATLAGFANGQPGAVDSFNNVIVGGDATTNLFQRGTTGASQTTTVAYGGPDRFAYWSGASTAMTVSRTSAATDVPSQDYEYAFKMARTSGQTGVVQMCMAQEVESVNSYALQGQTVELDFHAIQGANYSGGNIQAYIIYGTGTDDGMAKLAFGLNGGGGGSSGWAGQANAVAGSIAINSSTAPALNRYTVVGNIPVTATEVGIAICYTPTGTAGTNDYVAISGIALMRNASQSAYAGTANLSSSTLALSFPRRPLAVETALQYRYYYQITDSPASTVPVTLCQATTTSAVVCPIQFPVPMRAAPTATASATTAFGDTATAGAPTACTAFAVVASSTSVQAGKVTCTAGATTTAGGSSQLVYEATGANVNFAAEL